MNGVATFLPFFFLLLQTSKIIEFCFFVCVFYAFFSVVVFCKKYFDFQDFISSIKFHDSVAVEDVNIVIFSYFCFVLLPLVVC